MTILYAVILLGILIFVHELGHFLVAKFFNVKVEKFSLGFGPKLLGKQIGETEYLISAFPLGGFVKMFGETGAIEGGEATGDTTDRELTEEEKLRSFAHKPTLQRIAIVAAGPIFNLIFAWFLFVLLHVSGVPSVTTKIGNVIADKPAQKAGIKSGDYLIAINGRLIRQWDEISAIINKSKGEELQLKIKRGADSLEIRLKPEPRVAKNLFGEQVKGYAIGIASAGEVTTESSDPFTAVIKGTQQTWKVIDLTFMSLVKMAQRIVPLDSVGGPIMIAKMAGETAQAGGGTFLAFMALLSINLGVLNLLPVPVLDGGHLFFFFIELIFRRPVSPKIREYAQQIGLFLLLSLMVLAFYNDIVRYVINKAG